MIWYKYLYLGETAKKHRFSILQKLRLGKVQPGVHFTGFYRTHPAFLHSMFHPCFLSISMVCIFPSPNQPCFMPTELHCHLGIRIPGKHSFPQ